MHIHSSYASKTCLEYSPMRSHCPHKSTEWIHTFSLSPAHSPCTILLLLVRNKNLHLFRLTIYKVSPNIKKCTSDWHRTVELWKVRVSYIVYSFTDFSIGIGTLLNRDSMSKLISASPIFKNKNFTVWTIYIEALPTFFLPWYGFSVT